jgi:hypothetical protein
MRKTLLTLLGITAIGIGTSFAQASHGYYISPEEQLHRNHDWGNSEIKKSDTWGRELILENITKNAFKVENKEDYIGKKYLDYMIMAVVGEKDISILYSFAKDRSSDFCANFRVLKRRDLSMKERKEIKQLVKTNSWIYEGRISEGGVYEMDFKRFKLYRKENTDKLIFVVEERYEVLHEEVYTTNIYVTEPIANKIFFDDKGFIYKDNKYIEVK